MSPFIRLTGLKVSRPKLPLLFRLPISVWELDWDIPSKNGLIEDRQEKPQDDTFVTMLEHSGTSASLKILLEMAFYNFYLWVMYMLYRGCSAPILSLGGTIYSNT